MNLRESFHMKLHSLILEKMDALAKILANSLRPGMSICFWGDLGAGKSTLARLILQTLDPSLKDVPSPTFTLVQEYQTSKGVIWHCDFYRLKSPHDIINLGMEDAFYDEMCLIEWPEKIEDYLPQNRLDVQITINSDTTRDISLSEQGNTKGMINDFSF